MIDVTVEYLNQQGLSPTFQERFWRKVNKTETCWTWTGALNHRGYGSVMASHVRPDPIRTILAHRGSWIIHFGPIPDGMLVCHRCDNPPCVRPDHLFLGTDADNCADKRSKGREWHPVGESAGASKYSAHLISEVRRLYATGDWTVTQIARHFRLPISTAFNIVKRKFWKHI